MCESLRALCEGVREDGRGARVAAKMIRGLAFSIVCVFPGPPALAQHEHPEFLGTDSSLPVPDWLADLAESLADKRISSKTPWNLSPRIAFWQISIHHFSLI